MYHQQQPSTKKTNKLGSCVIPHVRIWSLWSFVDFLLAAFFHGRVSCQREQVVAQSEKMKCWEVYQMYNKGTTHSFKSKRLTCSKTLPRLDLPPLTAQLEQHFNKNKRSVRTECVGGAREIIYHGNMLQLTCVLLSDTQSELSAKLRCSSLQTVTHSELV